ncbi:MAG: HesA/MoeB/ThiF family protein [Myxococcaceae bacterium]|nr:HesA/MoeB/ThiF family protein [Myxococcaceae bacterium]MCI0671350.1 HesA/MoeB/ThiF family protein [Myxococcaceae bacterium]
MTLASARILVVGAGGLGCPATLALARAGARRLTVLDPDVVDLTNLHRQLWHRTPDIGRPKVDSLAERLQAAFPSVQVDAQHLRLTEETADSLFAAHTLVVDGTDGVATKFVLADAAVRTGVPLVYGGVLRWSGQVMALVRGGPCLRCLFEEPPEPGQVPTCAAAGVLGPVAGWVGGLQAQVALEVLSTREPRLGRGTLHVVDGRTLRWRRMEVRRRADCACARAVSEVAA